MIEIVLSVLALILFFNFLLGGVRYRRRVFSAICYMTTGVAALLGTVFVAGLLGVVITVTVVSVFISLVLGIPGVILLTIMAVIL